MFTAIITIASTLLILCLMSFILNKINKHKNNKTDSTQHTIHKEILPKENMISFREDLPFIPDYNQVIYIETDPEHSLEKLITNNYQEIKELFSSKGYTFFHLDYFNSKLRNADFFCYIFPDTKFEAKQISEIELNYSDLLSYLEPNSNINNCLIRYSGLEDSKHYFYYYELNEAELQKQLAEYLPKKVQTIYFKNISPKIDADFADLYFDEQSNILIQEIKERIEKLRILGIEEMYIKSLFDRKPKLSRMVITKDYKIMLPDYNKEIVMHPLPKAVYFMFLNHPQGIIFKHLPDYKNELHNIYKKITARNEIDDVIASINSITDPTNNAINEKCSRIREAFIKEFDSRIAEQYFITGKRGEPKKVLLEQSLITYETHN